MCYHLRFGDIASCAGIERSNKYHVAWLCDMHRPPNSFPFHKKDILTNRTYMSAIQRHVCIGLQGFINAERYSGYVIFRTFITCPHYYLWQSKNTSHFYRKVTELHPNPNEIKSTNTIQAICVGTRPFFLDKSGLPNMAYMYLHLDCLFVDKVFIPILLRRNHTRPPLFLNRKSFTNF